MSENGLTGYFGHATGPLAASDGVGIVCYTRDLLVSADVSLPNCSSVPPIRSIWSLWPLVGTTFMSSSQTACTQ